MLTRLERRMLAFVGDYLAQHDHSPSLSEIGAALEISSRGTVNRYVHALIAKGVLCATTDKHRHLYLPAPMASATTLPLLGRIAAGRPIEAIAGEDTLDLAEWVSPHRFVLKVCGDSMIDDGIFDGDYAIIERGDTAVEGDTVVALIDNTEATLKHLHYLPDDHIKLAPANAAYAALIYPAKRVTIQGTLATLLRRYRK